MIRNRRAFQRCAIYGLMGVCILAGSSDLLAGSVAEDISGINAALPAEHTQTVVSTAPFLPRSLALPVFDQAHRSSTSSTRAASATLQASAPLASGGTSLLPGPETLPATWALNPAQQADAAAQRQEPRQEKPSPDADQPSREKYAPFVQLNHSSP